MHPVILILQRNGRHSASLIQLLDSEGMRVLRAEDEQEALQMLGANNVDVVIDADSPQPPDESAFVEGASQRSPETIRVLIVSHDHLEAAVTATNEGRIFRYILRPASDEETLTVIMAGLKRRGGHAREVAELRKHQEKRQLIDKLEKQFPGIGQVNRDTDGSIIL